MATEFFGTRPAKTMEIMIIVTHHGPEAAHRNCEDKVLPGIVVSVRTFEAHRNTSDTLDYSDYRTVECVEALVYIGEHNELHPDEWQRQRKLSAANEPHDRFQTLDFRITCRGAHTCRTR